MSRWIPLVLTIALLIGAVPSRAGWDEGVAAFTSRDFATAAREFRQLLEQEPDSHQVHFMLGLSLEALADVDQAVHHLRRAYELSPNPPTRFALARAYYNLRSLDEVVRLLDPVDTAALPDGQRAAFYQMRGQARLATGDEAGALSDLEVLAGLRPTDVATQHLYGMAALGQGRLDTAIEALTRALELAPEESAIRRVLAKGLLQKGGASEDSEARQEAYERAAELAKELAEQAPSYEHLLLRASAALGAKLYGEAAESAAAATAKPEADWLAHFYLGQAVSSDRRYAEAEGPFRTALEMATAPADRRLAWTQLGFVYEKQRKWAESIQAYESAGDAAAAARVRENERIASENRIIEEENRRIREMEEKRRRLEEELEELPGGRPPG